MNGPRVALLGGLVSVAVFGAVFLALQADRWLDARPQPSLTLAPREGLRVLPASESLPVPPFDFTAAARRIMPSVVSIDTALRGVDWSGREVEQPLGSGSGVVVTADGHVMTNAHVLRDPRTRVPRYVEECRVTLEDGRSYQARVVGVDPRSDLAVLKVDAGDLAAAVIGDSTNLEIGQWVMAVGNPLGYENTLSVGVVSSLGRTLPSQDNSALVDAIQTDAAINQGNSGGALANSAGELVGINTAIASIGGGSIGIGFAIPARHVQRVFDDIIKYGYVRYAGLGLGFAPVPWSQVGDDDRRALMRMAGTTNEPPAEGLLITDADPDRPAGRAGVRQFDILTQIDGKPIRAIEDVWNALWDREPGETVSAVFWMRGETRAVRIGLADIGR